MNRNLEVLDIAYLLSLVRELAESRGFPEVGIFGSYARGEADAASDIDVLVNSGDRRGFAVFGMGDELSEITGKDVDIYDFRDFEPGPVRSSILKGCILA